MSHDNDFPENHDAPRTRTHARPRPAKKPLAAQEGQRIPARRADEHAYPVETPGRSSEPRAPRAHRFTRAAQPCARRTTPAAHPCAWQVAPVSQPNARCPNINVETLKNRIRHCGRVRCARARPVRRRALAKH